MQAVEGQDGENQKEVESGQENFQIGVQSIHTRVG
jgi:hypothetical protein